MSMSRYFVKDNVHVCFDAGHAVFLDVKRDRYFGLNSQQTRLLGGLVAGWPKFAEKEHPTDAARQLAADLESSGLLTPHPSRGANVRCAAIESAETSLVFHGGKLAAISAADALKFAYAVLRASYYLKLRSFAHAVDHMMGARRQWQPRTEEEVRGLVAKFDVLRPLAYSRRERCLFDSLALSLFLEQYGISATWVVAVKCRPFRAHSWVQHGEYVLNDSAEYVSEYKPILCCPREGY